MIINYIKNKKRSKSLNILTNNLGTIKEDDDKVICYVSKEKIIKEINNNSVIDLSIKSNCDKKIIYVFDKINFVYKNNLSITGNDIDLLFNECIMDGNININIDGNVSICNSGVSIANDLLLFGDNIELKNISIFNSNLSSVDSLAKIDLSSKNNINIIDCLIKECNMKKMDILFKSSENINLSNLKILCNKINLSSKNLVGDGKTNIKAKDIFINSKNYKNIFLDVDNLFSLNNYQLNLRRKFNLDMITSFRNLKMLELIELLDNIKSKINYEIEDNTNLYRKNLEDKNIYKVLRR